MRKNVFRALTYYHLFQILLLFEKKYYNVIYLEGQFDKKTIHLLKKYFDKVYVKNRFEISYKFFVYPFFSFIHLFKIFFIKNQFFYCSFHNHSRLTFIDYLISKKIMVLSDGNFSILKKARGKEIFFNKSKKTDLRHLFSYFLNNANKRIEKIFFLSNYKNFLDELDYHEYIHNKIQLINFKELMKNSFRKKIFDIFFHNNSLKELKQNSKKKAIIITQPLTEKGLIRLSDQNLILTKIIKEFQSKGFCVFFKEHPSENDLKYDSIIKAYKISKIPKYIPFEFLELLNINFEISFSISKTSVSKSPTIKNHLIYDKKLLEKITSI